MFAFSNYEKYFMQSLKVRRLISDDFKNIWKSNYDFLLTPTTLTTAPLLSEFKSLDNRTQCATQDYCTQPANMAGKYNSYTVWLANKTVWMILVHHILIFL